MNLDKIKEIAFQEFGAKRSHSWAERGNKYAHGLRVAKLALTLREKILIGDGTQDEIITVAAWFHDIENGTEGHERKGAKRTRALLYGHCTDAELEAICGMIEIHDDRYFDRTLASEYLKILQDADQLDHFGVQEFWRAFLEAPSNGRSFDDTARFLKARRETGEVAKFRSSLNYPQSREIMDEKIAFADGVIARMEVEGKGEIY
ncbi:MAG: HD domain-containing protein [Clostridiales bacterium]|jgi:uncharacterized protein|nr:HD domain-containing protein [Clostridiales bacterium]